MNLDFTGLKCPQPIIKLTIAAHKISPGTLVDVQADCAEFPSDIKRWCSQQDKTLLYCTQQDSGAFTARIQF